MRNFINIIYSSKVKYSIILIVLFTLYIFISALSYVDAVSSDISNSVFRLHVLANSDSKEDQDLKYIVRDKLLEYMNSLSVNLDSKEEVIKIANENKENFKQIALDTIKEQGYNYDVNISIDNFYFPTKTYGDISLPSGDYDALRVEIGSAEGKNWWCVMFPPLCFVDVSSGIVPDDSKDIIKSNLSDEEYSLLNNGSDHEESDEDNNAGIRFKFKLVEFFNNSNKLTAKN